MQPEDIIQNKEWQELTAEEKEAVKPLAADEQEYNLLKKMMLVAGESAGDVPSISPAIQYQLHRSVKKGFDRRWLYAAAVLLLVAVSGLLVLNHETVLKPPVGFTPPKPKKDSIVVRDTIVPIPPTTKPEITTKPKEEPIKPIEPIKPVEHPEPSYASISTLLKDDTTLMAFVTEVY
jgi:hypothetical protein